MAIAVAGLAAGCLRSSRYDALSEDYARIPPPSRAARADDTEVLFTGKQLGIEELSRAVLERNPSLEAARQAWRGALARYPEATSYKDPTITYSIAPLSIVSSDVKLGQGLQISQPLPYPGKRKLRGQIALAEAEAEREGFRAARRRLALMASELYYDYFVVARALEINREHTVLVRQYIDTVNIQAQAGRAWREDSAEIEVNLAELDEQRLALESHRDVVIAQLNSLLHRRPELAIPPPPTSLAAPAAAPPSLDELRADALRNRPELRAAALHIDAAKSSVALAKREYYPDFRVIGTYNGMWAMVEHQLMLGLSINLPVQRGRRDAAVDRANAGVRRARATLSSRRDSVSFEVEKARRRAEEADKIVATYRDSLLPSARARVEANRAGVQTGRTNFVDILREERNLKTIELRYATAIASAHRYRAELDTAVGRIAGLPRDGGAS